MLTPDSRIEGPVNRRAFLRLAGVGVTALGVQHTIGQLLADEPLAEEAAQAELQLPRRIRECPNADERMQLALAWTTVKCAMESTKVPDGTFNKAFDSHADPTSDPDFVAIFRRSLQLQGVQEDKEGMLTGGIRLSTPRVHGSMACKNFELIISVGLIQDELINIEASPTTLLRRSNKYTYNGLGPLTCSIINAQGVCVRAFPILPNGTGRISLEGIPFPFSIKFTDCKEAVEQEVPLRNGAQPLFSGDYAIV